MFVWYARVHHFKKYLCCFSGADAVRWLIRSGNAGAPDSLHVVARPSEPLRCSVLLSTSALLQLISLLVIGSDGEAVLLGNAMMRAGLLHHVKYKRPFERSSNLYGYSSFPHWAVTHEHVK